MEPKKRIIATVVGVIFVGVGVGVVLYGKSEYEKARASVDWPSVQGEITESRVHSYRKSPGSGTSSSKRKRYYEAIVEYQYAVDGQSYTSDGVGMMDGSSTQRSRAERVVRRYPKRKTVTVFYDPAQPEIAVLAPGVSTGNYFLLGGGALFALVGLIVAVGGLLGIGSGTTDAPGG